MMETDVTMLYDRLSKVYPICLNSSLSLGFKSGIGFPVLRGHSVLGNFELFYDDVSFPFYVRREDGELIVHWHVETMEEAEKCIADFMEGISVGQQYNS